MKLLMHSCCAPCSIYCVDTLRKEKIEPTIYFYNPNIHPYIEYRNRRNAIEEYCKLENLNLIVDDEYGLKDFCSNVIDKLNTRCIDYCYPIRLKKVFEYAKENGYDAVTTTLLYSIYQKHDAIKKICEDLSKEYNIEFIYRDFREGFRYGQEKARSLGIYMQKYCGCIFSEEDRYQDKIQKDKKKYGIN